MPITKFISESPIFLNFLVRSGTCGDAMELNLSLLFSRNRQSRLGKDRSQSRSGKQKIPHKNHMKMEKCWNDCQSCETLCVLKIGTKQS